MSWSAVGLGTTLLTPALAQIPSIPGTGNSNPFASGGFLSGFSDLGTSLLGSVNGLASTTGGLLNSPNLLLIGGAVVLALIVLK